MRRNQHILHLVVYAVVIFCILVVAYILLGYPDIIQPVETPTTQSQGPVLGLGFGAFGTFASA